MKSKKCKNEVDGVQCTTMECEAGNPVVDWLQSLTKENGK